MHEVRLARRHGRRSTYVSGCRCGACCEANRLYFVAYRARVAEVYGHTRGGEVTEVQYG